MRPHKIAVAQYQIVGVHDKIAIARHPSQAGERVGKNRPSEPPREIADRRLRRALAQRSAYDYAALDLREASRQFLKRGRRRHEASAMRSDMRRMAAGVGRRR